MDCVHFTVLDGNDETMFVFLDVNDDLKYVEDQLEHLKKLVVVFRMAQHKSHEELVDELSGEEIELLNEVEEEYDTFETVLQFVRDYAAFNDLTLADCVDEITVAI